MPDVDLDLDGPDMDDLPCDLCGGLCTTEAECLANQGAK